LFLDIKGSRILLDQEDQLLKGLINILQLSKGQYHLIVQIGVVFQNPINKSYNQVLQGEKGGEH